MYRRRDQPECRSRLGRLSRGRQPGGTNTRPGVRAGTPAPGAPEPLELYEKACTGKASEGGAELAAVYMSGRTRKGPAGAKAVDYLRKACALGDRTSCLQVPTSDDPICKRMQKR